MLGEGIGAAGWLLAVVLWLVVGGVPGFLVATALRPTLPLVDRCAVAPLATVALGYVPALWASSVRPSSGLAVLQLALVVASLASGAVLLQRRRRGEPTSTQRPEHLRILGVVLGTGVLLGLWAVARAATSWGTVVPNDDGGRHGALVERVLLLGSVHPLDLETLDLATGGSIDGFYPTGLHAFAAVVAQVVGTPTALVTAVVVAAAVWAPLGAYALTRRYADATAAAVAAAVMGLVLVSYPGSVMDWGGWPLIVAVALVPAAVLVLQLGTLPRAGRRGVVAGAGAVAALAAVHPPEAVAAGLVALLAVLLDAERGRALAERFLRLVVAGVLGLVAVAPLVLAQLSGSAGSGSDELLAPWSDALAYLVWFPAIGPGSVDSVLLGIALSTVGVAVFAATVLGCLRLWPSPAARGLVVSVAVLGVLALLAFLGIARPLTMPWYGQGFRLLVQAWTLAVVPLAVGAVAAARAMRKRFPGHAGTALVAGLAVLCAVPLVVRSAQVVDSAYDKSVVTAADRDAIRWLAEQTRPGERVLNDPEDGSVWAYALSHGRVAPVFGPKPLYGWGHYPEWASRLELLDRAGAIPTDAGLAKAADDWGVRYVLVLERPFAPDRRTIDVEALRSAPGVRLVFRSGRAAVYQVRP